MTSNRELARQLGVSETAVRRAEKTGRIKREADGAWDPAKVKAAWTSNTDQAQQRPGAGGGGGGFPVFKGALIKRTSNVTIASSVLTTLGWQSTVYDTDGS